MTSNFAGLATANMGLATVLPSAFFTAISTYVPLLLVSIATYMQQMDFLSSGLQTQTTTGTTTFSEEIYDFIVVGGGSSGAVVASRLSEKYKVLLLEAGGDPSPLSNIPFLFSMLLNQPLIDWQHQSCQTGTNSSKFVEPKCQPVPSGKCLGGTSSTNGMIYTRGISEDYNNWASLTGDDRWSYKNVERIFRKLENYGGNLKDKGYHGVGGPMHIERASYTPALNYWLDAGRELGFEVNSDKGYQTEAFNSIYVTQKNGQRFSTYRGYIERALKRENLTIHRFSLATKIHFDANMRAVGVEYLRHGIPKYASVTKEVVVSGGSVNSPKLLMLSGIGPREHLTHHHIPTLVDLPAVGQNYQDHLAAPAGPFIFNKPVSHVQSRDLTWGALRDYLHNGTGPFSSPILFTGAAFVASSHSPRRWPDLNIQVNGNGPSAAFGKALDQLSFFQNIVLENFFGKVDGKDGNIPFVLLGRPKSRGEVLLRDSNPLSRPLINPFMKYGDHDEDLQRIVEGLNYTVTIYESTAAFAKLGAKLPSHHIPGCERFELKSYSYWECYAKTTTIAIGRPTSTCSMGKIGDPKTVVDSQLRVLGTSGLRVADASIMPFVTNANINGPSIMIGEMCSEMILQDWST